MKHEDVFKSIEVVNAPKFDGKRYTKKNCFNCKHYDCPPPHLLQDDDGPECLKRTDYNDIIYDKAADGDWPYTFYVRCWEKK